MSSKRILPAALVLVLGAVLAAGLWLLFELRFEKGDNYPPYSTLRADPLGARVLHDALAAIPGIRAARNLRPLCELQEGTGSTLFYVGLDLADCVRFGADELSHLESFLVSGGRLVITLTPQVRASAFTSALTTTTAATSSTLGGSGSIHKAGSAPAGNPPRVKAAPT